MASSLERLAYYILEKEKKFLNFLTLAETLENLKRIEGISKRHAKNLKENNGHNPHLYGRPLARIVNYIADAWAFDDIDKDVLAYAAKIHDIGKVKIERTILNKPEKLSAIENKIMNEHPLNGEIIVQPFYFLGKLIRHHHEWYNGKGYPSGLKGTEIPFGSRIISVSDAYNAMTSDRPYQKAISKYSALQELKKLKGKQFDPEIVDCFVKIINEKHVTL